MEELLYYGSQKLRLVIGGFFILFGIVALWFIFSVFQTNGLQKSSSTSSNAGVSTVLDNPNIVAQGLGEMAQASGRAIAITERTLVGVATSVKDVLFQVGKFIASAVVQAVVFSVKVLRVSIVFIGSVLWNTLVFIVMVPAKIIGFVAGSSAVQTAIQPADTSQVPIIDTQLAQLYANQTPKTAKVAAASPVQEPVATSSTVAWPIHGRVTTQFGVPHWPYQATHTGLDISSGQRSGVTPIHSFRKGTVLHTVYSRQGLGNHVVVDHGGGLTSVYAHLYSITAKVGQVVSTESILGYEGSTGMSTGPHLHFEIRVNGQTVNPRDYVGGQP